MKIIHFAILSSALLLTTSCRTTSISSPGSANGYGSRNSFHKGELHTHDVLGILFP